MNGRYRYRRVLHRYLARQYTVHILGLLGLLLAIMALFDAIELMRRLAKVGGIAPDLIGYLTLLKIPANILTIAPFIVLFAAMFTLSVLNRRQELTVMRTAGASLWQLMHPLFLVAFVFGAVLTALINPMAAATERAYLQYEERYLNKEAHLVVMLGQGLWLRQARTDDQGADRGYVLLYARKVTLPEWHLDQVMALAFDSGHQLQERIDAPAAALDDGFWEFPTAMRTRSGVPPQDLTDYRLPTSLTRGDLEEQFSSPETVSFWQMAGFIRQLKESGFPVSRLQIHFGSLLLLPFLCAALVMIAVAVSVRNYRGGGQARLVVFGICLGFVVFFMNNFLQALGASGQIPIWLAVLGPTLLTSAAGVMAIFAMEDQ